MSLTLEQPAASAPDLASGPGCARTPASVSSILAARAQQALDVRLYAPYPDVVIIRVAGPLWQSTASLLMLRLEQQIHRAPHVIVDLSLVDELDADAASELRATVAKAQRSGTQVHLAGVGSEAIAEPLRQVDPGWRLVAGPADAVLATLNLDAAGHHRTVPHTVPTTVPTRDLAPLASTPAGNAL
ncbi:sodium-independent anion transporter [Pseudonocardia halophobica]|uniref:sodium-independent anion transporter n=1 Tax=Pseudonocardia halophobica TaxID=29401 RepID=UPI003D8D1E3B